MWFGLLGTLQVQIDDREVRIPGAKQRVLLAALLLTPRQAVSTARMCELVWDGRPPPQAPVTLRSYVKRLRQALGPAGGARIITCSGGYKIDVTADEVDIFRFEERQRTGIAAAQSGDWKRAASLLAQAEALWRGSPLADIPCEALQLAEAPRLEEQRLQATQWRIEAALQLGDHHVLTPQLQSLTAEYPVREPFHGQLMVALYRSGRQSDALTVYRTARDMLVSELGIEPGPELQLLHERILAGDRELLAVPGVGTRQPAPRVAASTAPKTAGQAPPLPRQLPAPVVGFTGRDAELAILAGLLASAPAGTSPPTIITAIGGTAGVGKTALAVQWAYQAAGSFPDGQLYVNLRGYDPGQPMTSGDALARLLRDLGTPDADIPADEDERAARFRSILAGRRVLVLLDNAGSADQVRPLLPGTPGSLALVTSRDALAGLVARDGARRLDLDLLPLADAVSLLRTLIGVRVDREPEAAIALAVSCCRLPLALRVAAELAVARPASSLARLSSELADRQQRLDLLEAGGDPRTAVRAVFSWSVRNVDQGAARAFRLLGLIPGPDLDAYATAVLTGTSLIQATHMLDLLERAHLIQSAGPGRFTMHDLLRDYAQELAAAEHVEEVRRATVTGLFDHYLRTAAAAMDTLYPAEQPHRPRLPAPAMTPPLSQPHEARAWLDAELSCLVAATAHAAAHGWSGHAINMSATLSRYLEGGHLSEAVRIHGYARGAAEQATDVAAEAGALTSLGVAELHQGGYTNAARHFEQALALRRLTEDRGGEARVLINAGILACRQGHFGQAADHFQLAMSLYRTIGNRVNEAIALVNLGNAELALGRLDQATQHLEQALALSRDLGDQYGEAYALLNLGDVSLRQGRYEKTSHYLQQVLALSRENGDRVGEASALNGLGELNLRRGRSENAARYLHQALALSRDIGARFAESMALNLLGEVSLAAGDHGQARLHHAEALAMASQVGQKGASARAHDGLARTHHAGGDLEQARHHWQQALDLYTEMGAPEAEQVRAKLASKVPSLPEPQ